jgi:hypothetical protein
MEFNYQVLFPLFATVLIAKLFLIAERCIELQKLVNLPPPSAKSQDVQRAAAAPSQPVKINYSELVFYYVTHSIIITQVYCIKHLGTARVTHKSLSFYFHSSARNLLHAEHIKRRDIQNTGIVSVCVLLQTRRGCRTFLRIKKPSGNMYVSS